MKSRGVLWLTKSSLTDGRVTQRRRAADLNISSRRVWRVGYAIKVHAAGDQRAPPFSNVIPYYYTILLSTSTLRCVLYGANGFESSVSEPTTRVAESYYASGEIGVILQELDRTECTIFVPGAWR